MQIIAVGSVAANDDTFARGETLAAEAAASWSDDGEALLGLNHDLVEVVGARTWRLLTRSWGRVCEQLLSAGVPTPMIRRAKRSLEYPVYSFDWVLSRAGGECTLEVDRMWFLTQVEGKTLRAGPRMPLDLLDQYLLGRALAQATELGQRQIDRVLGSLFGRGADGLPALAAALEAFERFRWPCVTDDTPSMDDARPPGEALELARWVPARVGHVLLASLLAALAGAALTLALSRGLVSGAEPSSEVWSLRWLVRGIGAGLADPEIRLGASAAALILGLVVAATLGQRSALWLTLLIGVPLEHPLRWFGGEARALTRRARWLADFLREKPRTNNTPGAHLAYGMIAAKRTLKELALRRERADAALVQGERRKAWLVRERNRAACRVYECLVDDPPAAIGFSRVQHAHDTELSSLTGALLARRLELQAGLLAAFERAWEEERNAGRVPQPLYESALAELSQPPGEPAALLPMGLVRSPIVWVFEYGMFAGRLGMALAFAATFQTSYLGLGLLLFALNLYVVEPVVFKLQMSALGPFLKGPGHALCDLQRYMQELPEGEVFRLPITVPKFSSNPAWTNLNAIIQAALTRSLTTSFSLVPFAMRHGRKHVSIELEDGAERDIAARTAALCEALETELENGSSKFPLGARVSAEGRRVTIELTDDDDKIWAMIGEDASQAIIYLWRNLRALGDTLAHLGPRFQPVFILASNTEDQDAIECEVAELRKLQAWSDENYGGQVGFLYLLRGGEWCSYASRLERFDEKDKTFAKAVGHFKQRLSDPETPAREHLLQALIGALEPKQLASAFNSTLRDEQFYKAFDEFNFERLPAYAAPTDETLSLLARKRAGEKLAQPELTQLNRELLLTALPMRVRGAFFKKVGNDIAVQELLVAGKTRPTTYVDRRLQEHVQDPTLPNYARVWGDFSRYTGLAGSSDEIREAILKGADLRVESVPELGAILDDKNEFAPGEIEKGLATLLHPDNRHIVIGVPRIEVTLPEHAGNAVASDYILAARAARAAHNSADALAKARLFSFSSPAYGKWFKRPKPYLAHYAQQSLNAAHALSHDFQQSYLVAGAGGRLGGFTEALYGPTRFEVRAAPERARAVGEHAASKGGTSRATEPVGRLLHLCRRIIRPLRERAR